MVSEPSAEARYFRFPIASLKCDTSTDLFQRIVRYCIIDCAINTVPKKFDENQIEAIVDVESRKYPGFKKLNALQRKMLVAAKLLDVSLGTLDDNPFLKEHNDCVQNFGRCYVIFPRDPFWQFYKGGELREFVVLCAVFAGIGDDAFKKLQYDRIGALASGYSSVKEMQNHRGDRVLTRDQIRWTVEKLENQGWFVRCPANRRHMYYSKRLSLPQLQNDLAKMAVAKQRKCPKMKKRAEELTRLIARLELSPLDPRDVRK